MTKQELIDVGMAYFAGPGERGSEPVINRQEDGHDRQSA